MSRRVAPWLAFEAAVGAAVAGFLLQVPFEVVMRRDEGASIVDFQLAGAADAAAIVEQWSPAARDAARMQILIDFGFAVAYVAALVLAFVVVRRSVGEGRRGGRAIVRWSALVCAVLAVVAGACDVIENVGLLRALGDDRSWARWFASVKFALVRPLAVLAPGTLVVLLLSRSDARRGWWAAHAPLRRWLSGVPPTYQPIVGWVPKPSPPGPPNPSEPDPPESIAICSSGGGIRSASFNLGALQTFMRAGIYQRAKFVTAVSGGCYISAAVAIARTCSAQGALTPALPAFAPGSPEETRLRTHMRYLAPDGRGIAIGALALLFGFVANLGTVLAGCFVGARVLGWTLHAWRVPEPPGFVAATAGVHVPEAVGWVVRGLLVGGLALYALERFLNVYWQPRQRRLEGVRTWALRLLAAGLVAGVLLVGVPALVAALFNLGASNSPSPGVARAIAAAGFTTNDGCKAVAEQARTEALEATSTAVLPGATVEYDACGQTFTGTRLDADRAFEEHGEGQAGTFVGVLAALLALIKTTAGRVGSGGATKEPKADAEAAPGLRQRAVAAVRRTVAPWAGTLLAIGLILIFSLRVTQDAMLAGINSRELARVLLVAAGLLVLPFFTDATRTSLHPMYRERLASVFAVRRTAAGTAEQVPYERPLSLSALTADGPELVICATANVDDVGLVPPGRGGAPFVFSRGSVGISTGPGVDTTGLLLPTAQYEQAAGERLLTVPGAVAISGAAVSPVMGRMTKAPIRFLLGIANVRLGVWLLNPQRASAPAPPPPTNLLHKVWARAIAQWQAPGVTYLLREMVGRNSIRRKYLYVTDGGHYDNYGLVEALRRRATTIYVVDGTGDTPPVWTTLGHAISLARADLGVEIELDAPPPEPDDDGIVPTNVVTATIAYPDGLAGRLVVGKLARPAFATYDVVTYGNDDASFPNKSTGDQLYGDIEFESYRKLGALTAAVMVGATELP